MLTRLIYGRFALSWLAIFCVCLLSISMVYAQDGDEIDAAAETRAQAPTPSRQVLLESPSFTEEDKPVRRAYSPWGFSYFNWATQNVKDTAEGVGRFTSYNYVSVDYRLNFDSKLSLRPTFYINGAGNDFFGNHKESEVEMGDIYLQYYRYSMALLPGEIGLSGALRAYWPLSNTSREQTLISRVESKLLFVKPISYGVQLTYTFQPKYFIYKNKSYLKVDGDYQGVRTNKWGELLHYFELAERVGYNWGFAQSVGLKHQWYYSSATNNLDERSNEYTEVKLSAFIDLGDVNFKFGLNTSKPTAELKRKFALFKPEDTEYSLMTYARF